MWNWWKNYKNLDFFNPWNNDSLINWPSKKKSSNLYNLLIFCGVNTSIMLNFKLPKWNLWKWSCKEMCIIGSYELLEVGSHPPLEIIKKFFFQWTKPSEDRLMGNFMMKEQRFQTMKPLINLSSTKDATIRY